MLTIKELSLFHNSPLKSSKGHVKLNNAKRLLGVGIIPLYNGSPIDNNVGEIVSVSLNNDEQISMEIPVNPIGNPNMSFQRMVKPMDIPLKPNSYLTVTQLSSYPFIESSGEYSVKIYVQWD